MCFGCYQDEAEPAHVGGFDCVESDAGDSVYECVICGVLGCTMAHVQPESGEGELLVNACVRSGGGASQSSFPVGLSCSTGSHEPSSHIN